VISRQVIAALTGFVGLTMLAGWLSAFRNRGYLGWLGFAFVTLSGSLFAAQRARDAQVMGGADPQMALVAQVLLVVCAMSFVVSVIAAARETARRIREIRERYLAAEEAMLEMVRASREREQEEGGDAAEAEPSGEGGDDG
jgi:hypothetical protein